MAYGRLNTDPGSIQTQISGTREGDLVWRRVLVDVIMLRILRWRACFWIIQSQGPLQEGVTGGLLRDRREEGGGAEAEGSRAGQSSFADGPEDEGRAMSQGVQQQILEKPRK